MNKFILIFLLFASPALADVAVQLYGDNPQGVPAEWPKQVQPLRAGDEPASGWIRMTDAELSAHKAAHQAEYDAWEAAKPKPVETDWKSFRKDLLASALGQRLLAAPPSNLFASFSAALVSEQADAIDELVPSLIGAYSITADEIAAVNALITKCNVPITKLSAP
jgi:hypothetical protein